MRKLTKSQILSMHEELIVETGGSFGVRDEGLLESAIEAPFQTYGNLDLYPNDTSKGCSIRIWID